MFVVFNQFMMLLDAGLRQHDGFFGSGVNSFTCSEIDRLDRLLRRNGQNCRMIGSAYLTDDYGSNALGPTTSSAATGWPSTVTLISSTGSAVKTSDVSL